MAGETDIVPYESTPMDDDYEWASHDPDLAREHMGKFVAVCEGKILAVADTPVCAQQRALETEDHPPKDRIVIAQVMGPPLKPGQVS